ncbi:helix-turn-helix domain-containing protein [Paenibacillus glucanolyticus]|uniref:helix-turn-helix domain-containing protein n=1 Tax=Paenibacillus glucanolyticus TaxID=59843 RepID=UPI003D007FBC
MLSDTERKILRIFWNLHGHEWFRPGLQQLCRLSQRTPGQVKTAVRNLIEKGYIEFQGGRFRVVVAWEPEKVRRTNPWEVIY